MLNFSDLLNLREFLLFSAVESPQLVLTAEFTEVRTKYSEMGMNEFCLNHPANDAIL